MKTNPNDSATGFAWSQDQQGTSGLTKREYFAAMALQGFLAKPSGTILNPEFVAKHSLAYADALINALNNQ